MRFRVWVALLTLFAAGVAVGEQGQVRQKRAALILEGQPGGRVLITVDVPGKKLLSVTVKPVGGDRFMLDDEKSANDLVPAQTHRGIPIEDENR